MQATRPPSRPPLRPPDSLPDLSRLAQAYLHFGAELWDRSWRIGCDSFLRAADEALGGRHDPSDPERLARSALAGLRDYSALMATVLPVALDGLSRRLDRQAEPRPAPAASGAAPPPRDARVVEGVPVVLPARIVDASEGWALYYFPTERVRAEVREQARSSAYMRDFREQFELVDLAGRTPVTLLACDYRESDLGVYAEIGVCLHVRPRGDPTELPGTFFLSLTVNDRFNVPRATALWGYRKGMAERLRARYERSAAHFAVDPDDADALAVSFPRFGSGRTRDLPIYTYGMRKDAAGVPVPQKALISRSAHGEGVQVGGNVAVTLGDGSQPFCVCKLDAEQLQPCVCRMLRNLGLPERPAANGWLEHMSAPVSASTACRPAPHRPGRSADASA